MRVLITRYPASEDRLIVRPLLCLRCTLESPYGCSRQSRNLTVVLVFTQVWGYAKVWVLGRFWLRLGPRFGGAADPGFTPMAARTFGF